MAFRLANYAPFVEVPEWLMSKREGRSRVPQKILLATDLSCRGDRAAVRASMLANTWGAQLTALHALQPDALEQTAPAGLASWQLPNAASIMAERLIRRDFPLPATIIVREGVPADLILSTVDLEGTDLVVLGSEATSSLLGTTVAKVVRQCPVDVLVVRSRAHDPYVHVLAGTDFTAESGEGVVAAAAMFPSSTLTVMNSFDMPYRSLVPESHQSAEMRDGKMREMDQFLSALELPREIRTRIRALVEFGPPEKMLSQYVAAGEVDLTVIGALGRGALFNLLVGGATPRIAGAVPGDLLVIRAQGEGARPQQ